MGFKLVTLGKVGEDIRAAYYDFARAKIAHFVAEQDANAARDWSAILAVLADLLTVLESGAEPAPNTSDQVAALSYESVTGMAAMTGSMALLLGMTVESMIKVHDAESDSPTGYVIAAFMMGRKMTSAELGLTAHTLRTLNTDQRLALASFAAACLAVLHFSPDDVRALRHPDAGGQPCDPSAP